MLFVCAGIVTGVLVNIMGVSRIVWCVHTAVGSNCALYSSCQLQHDQNSRRLLGRP